MNGFDIDGVISIGIHPGPSDVIITGRSYEEAEETYKFLHARGIFNSVYFAPWKFGEKTREKSGGWKCHMIGLLNVNRFFEDDEIQFAAIKQKYPSLELVHVVSDLVNKENVRHDKYGDISE